MMDSRTPDEIATSGRHTAPRHDLRLTELVGAHRALVQSRLKRFGVDVGHTEDAAQDVFMIAARKIDRIEPGHEKGYLLGVATRVAANYRNARALRAESGNALELERAMASAPSADHLLDQKRAREALESALKSLPTVFQRVLILFELEGISVSQIAARYGMPVGTVASRLQNARRRLGSVLRRQRSMRDYRHPCP